MIKFEENTLNAEMVRGDTGSFSITLTDNNNNSLLKNGDIIYFTLRKKIASPILIEKKITTFNNGKAEIILEPKDTKELDLGSYLYDLKWVRPDGNIDTLIPNNPYSWLTLKEGIR